MLSKRGGTMLMVGVAVVVGITAFCLHPIPQPATYHNFADKRGFLGIPNFGDVASNLAFAAIGIWGLAFLLGSHHERPRLCLVDYRERFPYLFVFAGLLLTALGSAYYHLAPDNTRLVWDRLPMTIVFAGLVSAVICERINVKTGLILIPPLLLVGIASVLQWHYSELRGHGDLRFYAAVQLYSALVLILALLLRSKYSRRLDFGFVAAFYVLAKLFETADRPIFESVHAVSGHTLKHLAAATAGYWILRMLQLRRPAHESQRCAAASIAQ